MKIYRIYWFVILAFFIGCASSGVKAPSPGEREDVGRKTTKASYVDGKINEDFDPLVLRDDEIDLAKLRSERRAISKEQQRIQAVAEVEHAVFSEDVPGNFVDTTGVDLPREMSSGWRVQICAIANEVKARETLQEAEDVFETYENLKVYFTYDSPYYKVRLGDCTSRYQADRLLQIATEGGFVDAWIVKTNVYKQDDLFRQGDYSIESLRDSTDYKNF